MARFYEAVELEQASKSKAKAKTPTLEKPPPATTFRKRLGSMTEAERASFERRSELRRQSADMVPMVRKWDSREDINLGNTKNLTRTTTGLLPNRDSQEEDEEEEDRTESTAEDSEADMDMMDDEERQQGYDLGSDYTESTASTDQDSIEKFKMELLARTRSSSPRDLETYHPRNMGAGTFTPYRAPTPEQAALVLNRPVPLPSPDFVPKPILKRSSNEHMEQSASLPSSPGPSLEGSTGNGFSSNLANSSPSAAVAQNSSNLKLDLAKGIKSFFNRDKRTATEKNTEANEEISNPLEKTNAAAIAADLEMKRKAKEEEELRRKEEERLMQEEAHAAVDHYSDLVRQVSSTHKYHTPLYLDRDELKRAAARAGANLPDDDEDGNGIGAAEEHQQRRARSPEQDDLMLLAPPSVNRERRLSISEREQLVHVRDAASSHAMHNAPAKTPETPSSEQAQEEPEYPTVLVVPPPKTKSSQDLDAASESVMSEIVEARPDARGRTRLVKVKRVIKRRVPSSTRSRDASLSRPPTGNGSSALPLERSSQTALLLSAADRQLLEKAASLALVQSCSEEQAHEKVRSALSYSTDLVLFLVACYVYLFKDARLVLPILALMIYRQLGEAVRGYIPKWLRRKGSDGGV